MAAALLVMLAHLLQIACLADVQGALDAVTMDDDCLAMHGEGGCALSTLQLAVSSDGSSNGHSPGKSVDEDLRPFTVSGSDRRRAVTAKCSRCLRSCLPGEDASSSSETSYTDCVSSCGLGCKPKSTPEIGDARFEGIVGPENSTSWSQWLWSLNLLKADLLSMEWVGSLAEYETDSFKRGSAAYVTVQTMVHDRNLYNFSKAAWTADRYLADLKQRFGGVDQVLIWAGYPNIGVDKRSNLDMLQALPGGLKTAVSELRAADPAILLQIPYKPWDISTNGLGQNDPERYGKALASAGLDGINLDTMDSRGVYQRGPVMPSSDFFRAAEEAGLKHPIIEPELGLYGGAFLMNITEQSWNYWLASCPGGHCQTRSPFAPKLSLQKLLARRSMPHICGRWSTQRSQEILTAYFNAIGFTAWENIWGIWNGINPRDGELLRRSSAILRHFHGTLSDPSTTWLPFYPIKQESPSGSHVFASKFVAPERDLWLLINTATAPTGEKDWSLQVPGGKGYDYYDVHSGVKLQVELTDACLLKACKRKGDTAVLLRVPLEAHGLGAILKVPTGKLDSEDAKFLLRMKALTARPLSSFSIESGPVKQEVVPSTPSQRVTNTSGMIAVQGSGSFEFRIKGAIIEDVTSYGFKFAPLSVGVQYPWEQEPAKYHPAHNLSINDLWVDRYPVTNAQFSSFLNKTSYAPTDSDNFLQHWGCAGPKACSFPLNLAQQPVVFVGLEDARAYCDHVGKRLPHEWEWQYIAQGGDPTRRYPWGSYWQPELMPKAQPNASVANMTDVGQFPGGASKDGIEDLVGLIWHWTDEYRDAHTRAAVLRGGSAFQPNAHAANGTPDSRYQPWYFPGRTPPVGPWDAQWLGDADYGPKDYASLYSLTVHGKYLLMAPSLDRAGTIGFRCVADK